MSLNLKAAGLMLLAAFVLGTLATSPAAAEVTDHFTSNSSKTTLTGEQVGVSEENVFGLKAVAALGVNCVNSKVKLHGTIISNSVTEFTMHPTYESCTSSLGGATITTTGCNYIFKGTTDKYFNTGGAQEGRDATLSIECEAGKAIKVATGGCELSIGSESGGKAVNQNLLGVTYANGILFPGPVIYLSVDVTLDKIHYTTNNAFACSLAGIPETGADAYLTETMLIMGFEDNGTEQFRTSVEVS